MVDIRAIQANSCSEHQNDSCRHTAINDKQRSIRVPEWLPLVRHVLIESAHHYRFQPYRGKTLIKRQENLSQDIVDISWQAQKRLHEKYRHLSGRLGKQKAIVAVSKELAGFIWSIAKEVNKNVDLSGDEEIRYVEETLESSMC